MLDGYKQNINQAESLQPEKQPVIGMGLEKCWYHWDPDYPNGELNDELGKSIIGVLHNENISESNKIFSLKIAAMAAPKNLFKTTVDLIEQNKYRDLAYKVLLEIWEFNFKKDEIIANYNYFELLKKNTPEIFTYCGVYSTLSKIYRNKYAELKNELESYDLFNPGECNLGYYFFDPRAYEDSGYQIRKDSSLYFDAIARHLDFKFKKEWLGYLTKEQLYLLRNSIFAKYGYKFKSNKLRAKFDKSPLRYCKYGSCGKTSDVFSESQISEVDKHNIDLIKSIESSIAE
jgi:hypothetical protein